MQIHLRVSVFAVAPLTLGSLFTSFGRGQTAKTEPKGTTPAPAKSPLKLKVFKLERGDPASVSEGLRVLLEDPDMEIPAVAQPGVSAPEPRLLGGAYKQETYVWLLGGFRGAPPVIVPQWRAAVDTRTNSVVVRGSEEHLKVAADLVAIADRPENAPIPQLQILKVFPLKHSDSCELANVIRTMEFEDVKLSRPEEKLLVVIGPDEATKAIAEIVKELDVPTKDREKKEPELKK